MHTRPGPLVAGLILIIAFALVGCEGDTGSIGAQGPAGPAGPQGAAGANGQPGPGAFDPMPSGAIVRGTIGLDLQVDPATGGDYGLEGLLPASPAIPLDDPQVIVQPGTWGTIDGTQGPAPTLDVAQTAKGDPDALCPIPADTGTPGFWDQVPELGTGMTAGNVCVYLMESDHADSFIGFGRGSGFKLLWSVVPDATGDTDPNDNPTDMFVTAVWIYQEP